jgi:hypothetical protein
MEKQMPRFLQAAFFRPCDWSNPCNLLHFKQMPTLWYGMPPQPHKKGLVGWGLATSTEKVTADVRVCFRVVFACFFSNPS